MALLLGLAKDSTQHPYPSQIPLALLDLPDQMNQGHLAWQPGSTAEPSLVLGPIQNHECLKSPSTYVGAVFPTIGYVYPKPKGAYQALDFFLCSSKPKV